MGPHEENILCSHDTKKIVLFGLNAECLEENQIISAARLVRFEETVSKICGVDRAFSMTEARLEDTSLKVLQSPSSVTERGCSKKHGDVQSW